MFRLSLVLALVFVLAGCTIRPAPQVSDRGPGDGPIRHVIHISVDGLRPDAVTSQSTRALPHLYRLRAQSAFTDNARTDPDYSNTLPNHTAQLTGRPVTGPHGHGWTDNSDADPSITLHQNRGAYLPSVFDVAHDHGLRTGLYASKPKFAVYDRSYGADHGAPDTTGADHGRDKIDTFVFEPDTDALVARFVADMQEEPHDYAFLHLRDPDAAGHAFGWRLWNWHPYMRAVRNVDGLIGQVLALIESDARLAGHTALIVTADHGGTGHSHVAGHPEHYRIPFYVWAPGVPAGDLYALNEAVRLDPGTERPGFAADVQPVRNGAVANLALRLLDLDPVPGSTINVETALRVHPDDAPGTEPITEATASPDSTGAYSGTY